jgi:hypothetical protein
VVATERAVPVRRAAKKKTRGFTGWRRRSAGMALPEDGRTGEARVKFARMHYARAKKFFIEGAEESRSFTEQDRVQGSMVSAAEL